MISGICGTNGIRNACKGTDQLGDRRRWKDNIKVDLKEIGCEGVDSDSSGLGQDLLVSSCECGNESCFHKKQEIS
jgi:hypothetical protein